MHSFNKTAVFSFLLVMGVSMSVWAFPTVKQKNDRIFIHDRHGEAWEVTQALSIGFDPEKFQYGCTPDMIGHGGAGLRQHMFFLIADQVRKRYAFWVSGNQKFFLESRLRM